MLVLGLNYGDHDPSAALVKDGRLLVMVEQERVSRMKRAKFQAPTEAILASLQAAGATAGDVDNIAVGWDEDGIRRLSESDRRFRLENLLPGEFGRLPQLPPVSGVRHHLAHAASAFWCSGFERSAVLVVDGEGDDEATSLWHGTPDGLTEIASFPPGVSLGHFYKSATKYSGLEQDGGNHEGKLMGLAAYGRPTEPMPLRSSRDGPELDPAVHVPAGPRLRERLRDRLHAYWAENSYPYALGDGREIMAYANFAASVQAALERALIDLACRLREESGLADLAIAGGVAQNCAANGALAAAGIFDRIYVQPACHDAGVSIGAALHASHVLKPGSVDARSARLSHGCWGLGFSSDECRLALEGTGLDFRRVGEGELVALGAGAIADGQVVGWFRGRAEIGPRALGARSILADPRHRRNLVRINAIKSREVWRPLAPSVLEEFFDDFFACPVRSPFMNVACRVREEVRHLVPAVVHVDGTARPQCVSSDDSPGYWALIEAFRGLTGVPILLNTSFNLRGEPIVNSPRDAVRTFLFSPLDLLILEDYVVTKNG